MFQVRRRVYMSDYGIVIRWEHIDLFLIILHGAAHAARTTSTIRGYLYVLNILHPLSVSDTSSYRSDWIIDRPI